jgi:membrane-associated protein
MGNGAMDSRTRSARLLRHGLLAWVLLGLLATARPALAEEATVAVAADAAARDQPGFLMEVFHNLFNSHELMRILGKPEYAVSAFVVLNLIVFTETGLLVGFFLPGDSLLVTAGLISSNPQCHWSLPLLLGTLGLAAIIGDSVGYSIGYKTGPRIFCREQSFFFNKDHLLKAQRFYEVHGGKTIILARFMPILRTFAPVVAGVGRMDYRRFLFFNLFGGIGWVSSMVLFGYFLPGAINPLLKAVFGEGFEVRDHIEKVIIVVVLLSISPGLFVWLRAKMGSKPREEALVAGPGK